MLHYCLDEFFFYVEYRLWRAAFRLLPERRSGFQNLPERYSAAFIIIIIKEQIKVT